MSFRHPTSCNCNHRLASPSALHRKLPSFAPSRVSDNPAHNYMQMEQILMQERNKFKQIKERYQLQLDNEKKLRLNLENKLVKLKEEFIKKDVLISDLEFKENGCLNDNQSLALENEKLRNQLIFVEDTLRGRVLDLEGKLSLETKNGEDAAMKYDIEFEKFKKEGTEYIENLTQQYERKIKNLDERVKSAQGAKRGLIAEVKRLNDLFLSTQLTFDTQHRQTINRLRDQEQRKVQQLTKSFQQRFRAMQQTKQSFSRKVQDLNKKLQDKEKAYDELMNKKFQQIHELNQAIADITNQKDQINSVYSKMKIDLDERDKAGRNYNADPGSGAPSDAAFLKQQLQNKKREVDGLKDQMRQLKQREKEGEEKQGRNQQEMIDKALFYEAETKKYRDLYERLCEKLKLKINETINNACYAKR